MNATADGAPVWTARVHRVMGPLMLAVFVLSGAYMGNREPPVAMEVDAVRYQFRLNHLLLLMTGLVHVSLAWCPPARTGWPRRLQAVGTLLMVLGVPLLLTAFLIEPPRGQPIRPLTGFGVYSFAAGTVLHALAVWRPQSPTASRS